MICKHEVSRKVKILCCDDLNVSVWQDKMSALTWIIFYMMGNLFSFRMLINLCEKRKIKRRKYCLTGRMYNSWYGIDQLGAQAEIYAQKKFFSKIPQKSEYWYIWFLFLDKYSEIVIFLPVGKKKKKKVFNVFANWWWTADCWP